MLAKAAAFGLAWEVLPYGAFVVLALALYAIPFFRVLQLLLPFGIVLVFAGILLPNLWAAVLLSAAFFLILGIKDLILVHRGTAYEILAFLLFFLLFLNFFGGFDQPGRPALFLAALVVSGLAALLAREAGKYSEASTGADEKQLNFSYALGGFLLWQWAIALAYLPLNFFYQTALLFLAAVLLTELLTDHLKGDLNRRRILLHFSVFFVIVVLVLAANTWTV